MQTPSTKQIIRDLNLKVTDQRLLILETILSGRPHLTAQEVFENVKAKDASIGFATVYRFLRTLTEQEFMTEIRMGGLPARYEWNRTQKHHDHLTCKECGKICEFENAQIEKIQEQIAKEFGFLLTGHVHELYGLCSKCQDKKGMLPRNSAKH